MRQAHFLAYLFDHLDPVFSSVLQIIQQIQTAARQLASLSLSCFLGFVQQHWHCIVFKEPEVVKVQSDKALCSPWVTCLYKQPWEWKRKCTAFPFCILFP